MGNRPDIRNAKGHRRSSSSGSVSDCSTHQSLTRLERANPHATANSRSASGCDITWSILISSLEASPLRQQGQSLVVIHGLPRDKFLSKYIHSAQESQLHEKFHKIQVSEGQRASLSHLVANPLKMNWHLGPVKTGTVVMAEVVSFVHEVHLIHNGHGIGEIIFRTFRVTEGVPDPCGDCVDEIYAEKRNQYEHRPNSPIVNKDSSEISVVARHSPQHAPSALFIASRSKVGVGSKPQNRPTVVREIPQEIEPAGSIVAHRVASVLGPAVLAMVETHMSRPAQFRNVPIEIPEEEFEVAAEDFVVFLRKVALAPVCLQVAGAEHSHKPLELETVKRKIESDRQQQPRFP